MPKAPKSHSQQQISKRFVSAAAITAEWDIEVVSKPNWKG